MRLNDLRRISAVLLLVVSAGLYAQEVPEERVLFLMVPIVAEKVPGGFGSIWSTEVVAFNASGTEKLITGVVGGSKAFRSPRRNVCV
jgi:hypothetical protein